MAIIDDSKKNSFSHKPSKHQKDLTDGLKLKPMFIFGPKLYLYRDSNCKR
jgi:hypothetical protein